MSVSRSNGLSLVELMVALLMAGIMVAAAIPSFVNIIRDVEVGTQNNRLIGALNLARSEASKSIPGLITTTQVSVCKSDGALTSPSCDTGTCDSSGNHCWEKGWLVFRDANANGSLNDGTDKTYCPTGDCTLAIFPSMPKNFSLRTGGTIEKYIAYQPDGTAVSDHGIPNDTFRLCLSDDNTTGRFVIISSTGRVRTEKGTAQETRACKP